MTSVCCSFWGPFGDPLQTQSLGAMRSADQATIGYPGDFLISCTVYQATRDQRGQSSRPHAVSGHCGEELQLNAEADPVAATEWPPRFF